MKKIVIMVLSVLMGTMCLAQSTEGKKVIAHGWDIFGLMPTDLEKNILALEKLPIQGITINFHIRDEQGRRQDINKALTSPAWKKEYFKNIYAPLKRVCSGKLKNNFIFSLCAPWTRISWDDDKQWKNAANNMGLLASVAKECGAVGLLFDPEDYCNKKQFVYLPGKDKTSYEATALAARKRGRQIMEACAKEYPEIVILSFWLLSLDTANYNVPGNPAEILKEKNNLWIPFVEGMLDALPPKAKMVDATEQGYYCNYEENDFYNMALGIKRKAIKLISEKNKDKYQKQVQTGFGLYLDSYTVPLTHRWAQLPVDGSRLKKFQKNLEQALNASNEYCWLYGEKYRWVKWNLDKEPNPAIYSLWKSIKKESWNDILPGFEKAIQSVTEPHIYADEWYKNKKSAGKAENLVRNPQCKSNTEKAATHLPSFWHFWQSENMGKYMRDATVKYQDSFSVKAEGTGSSCFSVSANVQAGKYYFFEVFAKGKGSPKIRVRWKNNNNNWRVPDRDVFAVINEKAENGWKRGFGMVKVPAGVSQMVLLMSSSLKKGEICHFAKPGIFLMDSQF